MGFEHEATSGYSSRVRSLGYKLGRISNMATSLHPIYALEMLVASQFHCLQGWVEKEPVWPLWEHFYIRNLIARSLSEGWQFRPSIFFSLSPNTLCKKEGTNEKPAILRISGNS